VNKAEIQLLLKPSTDFIFSCVKQAFQDYEANYAHVSHTHDNTTKKNILFNSITFYIKQNIGNEKNISFFEKSDRTFLLIVETRIFDIYLKFKSIKDSSLLPSNLLTKQIRKYHEQTMDFEKPSVCLIVGYTMDRLGMLSKVYITYSRTIKQIEWYFELDAKTNIVSGIIQNDIMEIDELASKRRVKTKIQNINKDKKEKN